VPLQQPIDGTSSINDGMVYHSEQIPNFFTLATKELTQDSFFVWLLLWANQANQQVNPALNETAQEFVRFLIDRDNTYPIIKVSARRQWKNIDIWAEINDEYYICIEDKTNTGAHSGQLAKYKKLAEDHCNGKPHITRFIYLKTGNESTTTLNVIQDIDGYTVKDRKEILQILDGHHVKNDIFNDFRSYLTILENRTASGITWKAIIAEKSAAEGFYMKLQQFITTPTDWNSVSNPTGGFLGFWFHFVKTEHFSLYIQIENRIRNKVQVNIKIKSWTPKIETLHQIFSDLKVMAPKYELEISKPAKYRAGSTSTVAIVVSAVPSNLEEKIDMNQFAKNLHCIQQILDDYVQDTVQAKINNQVSTTIGSHGLRGH
jgi:hypothetical protein